MMPGSTTVSTDSAKAKVKSDTNGIFVRPVAVAGIFLPNNGETNKSPALPEKRRFSALVGDLLPISSSGDSGRSDDFARRRQSWDTRQKVPFGQSLLRKTPKNTNELTSEKVKSDDVQNGATNNSKSDVCLNSVKLLEQNCKTEGKVFIKSSTESSSVVPYSISVEQTLNKSSNNCRVETKSKIDNIAPLTTFVNNTGEPSLNKVADYSTDSVKQTKKVYGLIKRESTEGIKCDHATESDTKLATEIKSSTTKKKVYGLTRNKANKDLELKQVEKETKDLSDSFKSTTGLSTSGSEKSIEKRELSDVKTSTESVKGIPNSTSRSSPPKDFRTVRRTSDVIAAKIQDIFSNFQPEKPSPVVTRKSKVLDKLDKQMTSDSIRSDESSIQNSVSTLNFKSNLLSNSDAKSDKAANNKSVENASKSVDDKNSFHSEESSMQNSVSTLNFKSNILSNSDAKSDKAANGKSVENASKIVDGKKSSKTTTTTSSIDITNKTLSTPKSSVLKKSELSGDNSKIKLSALEPPHKEIVSNPTYSISNISSKELNRNLATCAHGKMPIKKDNQSSSASTKSFIIATNQDSDLKSSHATTSSATTTLGVNSNTLAKTSVSVTADQAFSHLSDKSIKTPTFVKNPIVTELSQNILVNSDAKLDLVKKSLESNITGKVSLTSSACSNTQTINKIHTVTSSSIKSTGSTFKPISSIGCHSETQENRELPPKVISDNSTSSSISKIEITKLIPCTSGTESTVNVQFRTKSPQNISNKEENRKKVVIETTHNSTSSVSPASIISPKPPDFPFQSKAQQSVADGKLVEIKTQSDCSPKLPPKNKILNLHNQELAVSLSSKTSPASNGGVKTKNSQNGQGNKISVTDFSNNTGNGVDILPMSLSNTDSILQRKSGKFEGTVSPIARTNTAVAYERGAFSTLDKKSMSIVDLDDWKNKFQHAEPETPKVPLRRRTFRDSLPPSLPLRSISRFGSLKRIDDSPRYIQKSPSQSSLPQRYSYTEMLSKVCSMGVLPLPSVDTFMSKSCSSSSSQVSELWSELSEEQSTATHASEMLETETTERMRLEKEVHDLQGRYSQVQQRSDKMEMEIMESRVYRNSELNGGFSDEDETDGSVSIYKQKYERAVHDMELMKRRIQQQLEEEMEQKAILKKASDKRLAEALEDVDEERQVANQWKRKAQKCGAELQDLRLMLEEQMARNGELEKKQRRFDAELSACQEEFKKEKALREKLMREKDQVVNEKYSLEQELQSIKLDSDMLHEKIAQLNRELDELTLSSKGEEEVTQLKRAKQELERKNRDQEEELEELAGQVQMLEQAKLRLEMSLEKVRQEHRREASVREEEIEEIRASFSKKIKNLEAQLESEQDERHQLVKQKHELERRLYELADQPPAVDPEIERRLRRDLKRTKALLRDAQSMLEHNREGQSNKTVIRQLKNQLEDSEFAKATAIKSRQAIETELQDCQLQLEEVTRTKNEAETKNLQLSREKSAIQTQLEEAEEEMAEVMKKYKSVVAQMSSDQKALAEQNQQIAEMETERQMLKDQLSEVSHKFEHLAGQSDDTHKVHRLDGKVRDLESKLELEQTTKARLEHQISRLKEQNDRAREECDAMRNKELQAQENLRRLQRQLRDLREDYSSLQQKEADAYRKQHELEMALENKETDWQVTKNDLRLACQRIQDLQNALEDDLDSGTDVPDDSGSDTDSSFELSVLRNSSITPIQRCESIASNLSYDTDGHRSRTASFSQELSAFSRMMLRRTSMDFLG